MADERNRDSANPITQSDSDAAPTGGSDNPSSSDLELRQLAENSEQEGGPETDIALERAGKRKPNQQ